MNPNDLRGLTRWPLLLGAVISIGIGVWLLRQTGSVADEQFGAFTLIVVGGILMGAFIRDIGNSSNQQPPSSPSVDESDTL